jgi:hypothetical protein
MLSPSEECFGLLKNMKRLSGPALIAAGFIFINSAQFQFFSYQLSIYKKISRDGKLLLRLIFFDDLCYELCFLRDGKLFCIHLFKIPNAVDKYTHFIPSISSSYVCSSFGVTCYQASSRGNYCLIAYPCRPVFQKEIMTVT